MGGLLLCFGGQSRHYAGKQNGKEHRQDGKQKPALVRAIQDVVRECIAKDLESKSVNSVNFQCASAQERTAADDLRGNFIQASGQQGQYNTQPRCNQDKRKPIQTIGPNTVIRDALDYVHQKPPAKAGKRNKRGGQSGRDFFVPGTVIGKTDAEEKKRQPRKQHEPDIREKWYRKRRTEEKQQNFSAQGRILTKRYKKKGKEIINPHTIHVPKCLKVRTCQEVNTQIVCKHRRNRNTGTKMLVDQPGCQHNIVAGQNADDTFFEKSNRVIVASKGMITAQARGKHKMSTPEKPKKRTYPRKEL